MGRKPVLGLAGLFLASVTLTGCENTDWCCWGKKTPEKTLVPYVTYVPAQKAPPKMPDNEPISRTPQVDPPIVPPADPSIGVPNNTPGRRGVGAQEESDMVPLPPKSVGGPDLNDPLLPNPPAKAPVTVPETNRGAKIAPPADPGPVLEELPSLEAPPPPSPVPDGATKSSSKYQNTPPSLDDPPPPVGVPVIKGGLKAN